MNINSSCYVCSDQIYINNLCMCGKPGCTGCRNCCDRRNKGLQILEEKRKLLKIFELRKIAMKEDMDAYYKGTINGNDTNL